MRLLRPHAARARRCRFLSSGGIARFRPRLEVLEDRRMLACEVLFRDGALHVLGDDSGNAVEINVGLRRVQVTCDGIDAGTFSDVRAAHVQLGDGHDEMKFNAEEALGAEAIKDSDGDAVPEIIDAFGGGGMDSFFVSAAAAALLHIDGGEDGDVVHIQFGRLFGSVHVTDTGAEGQDVLRAVGTRSEDAIHVADDDDAWIIKWEGPRLDGTGGTEVAIESIEIAHEGFEVGKVDGDDGDDRFSVAGLRLANFVVSGQGGDDHWLYSQRFEIEDEGTPPPGQSAFDGGEGEDRAQLVTTDLSEQIEILGIEDREVPDPRIIVTDLATSEVTADLSIVGTESIAVDSRGGDDRITMRDDLGPLANVNWRLVTGPGHDTIDAVLRSNPDEFFVDAGLGNDDVSIRFVGIPNVPEPNEPLPVIDVDMGAGVDGLLLDVFGSQTSPPVAFAAAEITPAVTLVEVLTSIFISGVGLLSLLTLFPLGSVEMHQAIQDDRAGHAKTEATIAIDGANLSVDLTTGATAESLLVDLAPVPSSRVDLRLDAGRGDDELVIRSTSPAGTLDWTLDVIPGGGEDDVVVEFAHGDPDQPIIIGALWNSAAAEAQKGVDEKQARMTIAAARDAAEASSFHSTLAGSIGQDDLQLDAVLSRSSGNIEVDLDWETGLGDDKVMLNLQTAAEHVIQKVRIDMGRGNDTVTCTSKAAAAIMAGTFPNLADHDDDWFVQTGSGDDSIRFNLQSGADSLQQKVRIDSGAGNDQISVLLRRLATPSLPPGGQPPRREDLEVDLIAGAGNDAIALRTAVGAGRQRVLIDAGQGDNSMEAYYDATQAEIDEIDMYYGEEGPHNSSDPEYDYGYEAGEGNDEVRIIYAAVLRLDLALTADTGGGDDNVDIALQPLATRAGTINLPPKDDPNQSPEATERFWTLALDAGAGHDAVALDAFFPTEPCAIVADFGVATGFGNDAVEVNVESAVEQLAQKVQIDSGAGDDRVVLNVPEPRRDGLADLIVGADAGAGPHVKVFDGATNAEGQSFFAYDPNFAGGVRVATGDVNGDGVPDIITAAGAGAGPHVKVFDGGTGALLQSFFAYGAGFTGGVYVAAGDINNDGRADIITGTGAGAPGGHVKVFDGRTSAELRSFFAFPGFSGGVRVAAGDVNGDGAADIITGAGPGGGPHVKVFDGRSLAELHSFFAYGAGFSGGIFVAAGDVDGDGRADIVTGADAGAPGGHVKVFSGQSGAELRSFFAFPNFSGGVRVAAGDVNGDGLSDVIVGAGPGAGPHVRVFDGQTLAEIKSFFAFDPSFSGGVFVAAGDLHASGRPLKLDLDLAIDTGVGHDSVSARLSANADELLQKVRIDTGAGNDSAALELLPYIEQDNLYQLQVNLGAGNDAAQYWVFGTELPPAAAREPLAAMGHLELHLLGGLGNDNIQGRVGVNRAGQSLPLALGQAHLHIDGGAGHDRISLGFRDTLFDDESVEAIVHGGDGHDQVRVRFDLGPGSTGQLSVQVFGDAGNDDLGLAILGEEQLDEFFALLDGGKGRDKCRATKNVLARNCEL